MLIHKLRGQQHSIVEYHKDGVRMSCLRTPAPNCQDFNGRSCLDKKYSEDKKSSQAKGNSRGHWPTGICCSLKQENNLIENF